jgi:multidrug efflux pump subunit AcrB
MENQEKKTGAGTFKAVCKWIYRLRSVILAIPVAIGAIVLAIHNQANLPETVGINIQASGEYAETVTRSVAVFGPLAVTAVCLLMVFCSKKVLYPWLISLFSLALPLLIYITNIFPG